MSSTEMQTANGATPPAVIGKGPAFKGDVADVLIPKLLIGQSTSKAVQNERVKFGEVFRSTTLEVLGGREKPIALIPLAHSKTWVLSQKVGGKYEFRRVAPYNPASDEGLPWTWTEGGSEWKREKSLNFYVLLPADIARDIEARQLFQDTGELPDVEASLLPCMLNFKSTSYKAGKTLVTHFAKASDFGAPPYISIFNLFTDKTQNEQGVFYTYRVERMTTPEGKGMATPKEYLETCKKWAALVQNSSVQVDESDLTGSDDVQTSTVSASGERTDF